MARFEVCQNNVSCYLACRLGAWRRGCRVSFAQSPGVFWTHWPPLGITWTGKLILPLACLPHLAPYSSEFFSSGVTIRGYDSSHLRGKTRKLLSPMMIPAHLRQVHIPVVH